MDEFVTIGGDRPRGFVLCGEQFVWRGVTPKQYSEWLGETGRKEQAKNDDKEADLTWETLCARADELVLMGLLDEDRGRYSSLREGTLNGASKDVVPTVNEVIALRNWIMEVETGRPPLLGTPSSDGPTESSEASSTDESSQEEEILVA